MANDKTLPAREIAILASLTERLAQAVENECGAMAERRFEKLQPLVEAKLQVVTAYEAQLARLGGPQAVAGDDDASAALRAPTAHLREMLALHTVQVAAARTVADRLMRSVADSVATQARPVLGYGPGAAVRTASAAPAAMAIHAQV